MKIEIIKNCLVNGQHAEAGSMVEVEDQTAKQLIDMKRAKKHEAKEPAKKSEKTDKEPAADKK